MAKQPKIIFNEIPAININEEYWYSDIELNKEYIVVDSYEKMINNKSTHFFLIQDDEGKLIEIPLSNHFKYIK